MTKHVMLGVNKDKCCILECLIDFNHLDIDNLSESDFHHRTTNWNGCDDIKRTLQIIKNEYKPTGYRIALKEPIVFKGFDSDCGHLYDWSFPVTEIWELECLEV